MEARVGSKVTVTITGAVLLAGKLNIPEGSSLSVTGEIIEDLGDSWLIKLHLAVDGRNLSVMPKTSLETKSKPGGKG